MVGSVVKERDVIFSPNLPVIFIRNIEIHLHMLLFIHWHVGVDGATIPTAVHRGISVSVVLSAVIQGGWLGARCTDAPGRCCSQHRAGDPAEIHLPLDAGNLLAAGQTIVELLGRTAIRECDLRDRRCGLYVREFTNALGKDTMLVSD